MLSWPHDLHRSHAEPSGLLPLLDRLGDRLEGNVASGAIASAGLLIGSTDGEIAPASVRLMTADHLGTTIAEGVY